MADYVRETILSQGYAHISGVTLSEQEKEEYELALRTYQKPRAERLLCADIQPEVRTKDGSLIVYTTIYGSLAKLIGSTDDLLESINSVYNSSRMLADACILESLFLSGKHRKNLTRSEARTGVIKTTKDILDAVENLTKTIEDKAPKKAMRDLDELFKKIAFLDPQLKDIEDKKLIWTDLHARIQKMPKNPTIFRPGKSSFTLDQYKKTISDLDRTVAGFIPKS